MATTLVGSVLAVLLSSAAMVIVVLIPGSLLYRLTGASYQSIRVRLAIQFALGLTLLPIIGILLSSLGRINALSMWGVYGFLAAAWVANSLARRDSPIIPRVRFTWSVLNISRLFIIFLPYLVSLVVWYPYLGAHTADPGLHTFWSTRIISTGRLPDYSVVGPAAPPEIFVFGAHLFLATISLVSQVSISDFFWVPLLTQYSLILLTVQTITLQILKSRIASTLASLFYVTSQIPAARILLGNLPDIIGYFLVGTLVLVLLTSHGRRSTLVLSLVGPAVIVYYQYALLTEVVLLLSTVGLVGIYLLRFHRVHLPSLGATSLLRSTWVLVSLALATIESLLLATQVSYLSGKSVQILQATTWVPVEALDYARSLGNPNILYLGTIGVGATLWQAFTRYAPWPRGQFAVTSWASALFAASSGPRIGLGVEPIRFVWHMVEPLSIMAGIAMALIIQRLCGADVRTLALHGIVLRLSYLTDRARLRTAAVVLLILATIFIISPFQASWPGWHHFPQPFYQDDVSIGLWLAGAAAQDAGIAVNSDVDNTATWVQAWSMRPRFFYRADYAINVSAPVFASVYRDMARLYNSPESPDAYAIVQKYDISFIVVHKPEFSGFQASQYFVPVYTSQYGNVTVFQPMS